MSTRAATRDASRPPRQADCWRGDAAFLLGDKDASGARRLNHAAGSASTAHENRHRAQGDDFARLAAEQDPGEPAPAVRGHDDQVTALRLRRVDDALGRMTVLNVAGGAGNA